MKTKFSPRLFIATSAIALGIAGAATSALAMPFGGNGPDGGGRSGHHMMFGMKGMTALHDDLKLDAKQEAAWQQADKASKDAMTGVRDRMAKHHEEIKAMVDKPGTDLREVAKRMDDFRAEGQKLHQENRDRWLAVYDTLNPEQKEKVRVFFKGMSERMGKMGRHGGRGDMDGRGQRDGRGPAPDAK